MVKKEEASLVVNRVKHKLLSLVQNFKNKTKEVIKKKTRPLKQKIAKTPDTLKDFFFEKDLKMPSEIKLVVNNISKKFGSLSVIKNISFELNPRDVFGIIGLSGSGKTTLLNIIVGFLQPDQGKVLLKFPDKKEIQISETEKYAKRLIGFATQKPSFYPKLTVFENLMYFAALYNIAFNQRDKRCKELIDAVGLAKSKDALAQNLSAGMQKRLDIACALIHKPRLLVLDEPTADLDPFTQMQIWNMIKSINAEKTSIILTSHSLSEVEFLCSRVLILGQSKTMVISLENCKSSTYSVEVVLSEELKINIPKKPSFSSYSKRDNALSFSSQSPDRLLKFLLPFVKKNNVEVKSFSVSEFNIKEQFEECIK